MALLVAAVAALLALLANKKCPAAADGVAFDAAATGRWPDAGVCAANGADECVAGAATTVVKSMGMLHLRNIAGVGAATDGCTLLIGLSSNTSLYRSACVNAASALVLGIDTMGRNAVVRFGMPDGLVVAVTSADGRAAIRSSAGQTLIAGAPSDKGSGTCSTVLMSALRDNGSTYGTAASGVVGSIAAATGCSLTLLKRVQPWILMAGIADGGSGGGGGDGTGVSALVESL